MSEQQTFNTWWMTEGQFVCAGGQPDHRAVIRDAFMAGWIAGVTKERKGNCQPEWLSQALNEGNGTYKP